MVSHMPVDPQTSKYHTFVELFRGTALKIEDCRTGSETQYLHEIGAQTLDSKDWT